MIDDGEPVAWAEEKCPRRGPGLTHIKGERQRCLHCGIRVTRVKPHEIRRAEYDPKLDLPDPAAVPLDHQLEVPMRTHRTDSMVPHPNMLGSMIAHRHAIVEDWSIAMKNEVAMHVMLFHGD